MEGQISLNFNDDLAVIATKECMEQLAGGYLLSMKKHKGDYYTHSSLEVYFNKIIKIAEIEASEKLKQPRFVNECYGNLKFSSESNN